MSSKKTEKSKKFICIARKIISNEIKTIIRFFRHRINPETPVINIKNEKNK